MRYAVNKAGLTAKQERFVAEYLIDCCGAKAAVRAGYSERTAKSVAHELLRKPAVKAAVNAAKKRLAEKLELTVEKVIGDIARVADKAEKAEEYGAALKGHELLGKHLKMFTEKHEHSGGVSVYPASEHDEAM